METYLYLGNTKNEIIFLQRCTSCKYCVYEVLNQRQCNMKLIEEHLLEHNVA
jgi:hypothetical protein